MVNISAQKTSRAVCEWDRLQCNVSIDCHRWSFFKHWLRVAFTVRVHAVQRIHRHLKCVDLFAYTPYGWWWPGKFFFKIQENQNQFRLSIFYFLQIFCSSVYSHTILVVANTRMKSRNRLLGEPIKRRRKLKEKKTIWQKKLPHDNKRIVRWRRRLGYLHNGPNAHSNMTILFSFSSSPDHFCIILSIVICVDDFVRSLSLSDLVGSV